MELIAVCKDSYVIIVMFFNQVGIWARLSQKTYTCNKMKIRITTKI